MAPDILATCNRFDELFERQGRLPLPSEFLPPMATATERPLLRGPLVTALVTRVVVRYTSSRVGRQFPVLDAFLYPDVEIAGMEDRSLSAILQERIARGLVRVVGEAFEAESKVSDPKCTITSERPAPREYIPTAESPAARACAEKITLEVVGIDLERRARDGKIPVWAEYQDYFGLGQRMWTQMFHEYAAPVFAAMGSLLLDQPADQPTDLSKFRRERIIDRGECKYVLARPVGKPGGFGTVWEAYELSFAAPTDRDPAGGARRLVSTRIVATKINRVQPGGLAQFEREAELLRQFDDHPNIAKVHAAAHLPPSEFLIVMELIDGDPIDRYCDDRCLPLPQRLELFRSVCAAVQHVNNQRVVHRDLKPANILVATVDGWPLVKIVDFGLAKSSVPTGSMEESVYSIGEVAGTLAYMAPEALDGKPPKAAVDVYSLGVTLYELLSGLLPYDPVALRTGARDGLQQAIRQGGAVSMSTRVRNSETKVRTAEARGVTPHSLVRALADDLDAIVERCLETDPSRRYGSVASLWADIQRHLAGELVHAARYTWWRRTRKSVVRYRVQLSAVAGGLFILAVMFVLWRKAELAEKAASDRAVAVSQAYDLSTDIFDALDAEGVRETGVELRRVLADQLARAVRKIDSGRISDVAVEVSLRIRLARALLSLGEPSEALACLSAAKSLRGDYSQSKLREMEVAALESAALLTMFRLSEAEPICLAALNESRTQFGEDADITIELANNLGEIRGAAGRWQESEEIHAECRRRRESRYGLNSPKTLESLNNLGIAKGRRDDKAAIEILRTVCEGQTRLRGARHPLTLTSLNNFAMALGTFGNHADAMRVLDETAAIVLAELGRDHPLMITILSNKGHVHRLAGRHKEAVTELRAALSVAVGRYAESSAETYYPRSNLGQTLHDLGRFEEAIPLFITNDKLLQRAGADKTYLRANNLNDLAAAQYEAGRKADSIASGRTLWRVLEQAEYAYFGSERMVSQFARNLERHGGADRFVEAEGVHRSVLANLYRRGTDSEAVASSLANLGRNLLKQAKWSEAESVLATCLKATQGRQTSFMWAWRSAALGRSLVGQGKGSEAQPHLERSWSILIGRDGVPISEINAEDLTDVAGWVLILKLATVDWAGVGRVLHEFADLQQRMVQESRKE